MNDYLDLKVPDDFKDNPYGYITNQISHIYLGFFFSVFYCFVLDKVTGFPDQTWAILIVTGIYLFWWELLNQGWRGFDTVEDTFYFFAGAASFLVIDMEWVTDKVFLYMTILWVPLFIGSIRRIKDDGE